MSTEALAKLRQHYDDLLTPCKSLIFALQDAAYFQNHIYSVVYVVLLHLIWAFVNSYNPSSILLLLFHIAVTYYIGINVLELCKSKNINVDPRSIIIPSSQGPHSIGEIAQVVAVIHHKIVKNISMINSIRAAQPKKAAGIVIFGCFVVDALMNILPFSLLSYLSLIIIIIIPIIETNTTLRLKFVSFFSLIREKYHVALDRFVAGIPIAEPEEAVERRDLLLSQHAFKMFQDEEREEQRLRDLQQQEDDRLKNSKLSTSQIEDDDEPFQDLQDDDDTVFAHLLQQVNNARTGALASNIQSQALATVQAALPSQQHQQQRSSSSIYQPEPSAPAYEDLPPVQMSPALQQLHLQQELMKQQQQRLQQLQEQLHQQKQQLQHFPSAPPASFAPSVSVPSTPSGDEDKDGFVFVSSKDYE